MAFPIIPLTTENKLEEWLNTLNEIISALDIDSNGKVTGVLPFASDSEAQAKVSALRSLTPANLAALLASETFAGLVEYATNAETVTGTATNRGVHPAGIKAALDARNASTSQTGLIETATDGETQAKSAGDKALTPSNLNALNGSEAANGFLQLATNSETVTGTNNAKAAHPAGIKAALDARNASTTQTGLLETATNTEAQAKSAGDKALTPSNLMALAATDSFAGLIEIATNTEGITGIDATRAMTAAGVKAVLDARNASTSVSGLVQFATGNETKSATSASRGLTASNIKDYCAPQTLIDAATIAFNLASGVNSIITLNDAVGAARTLGIPTNAYPGAAGVIRIQQSVTGSKTLSYNSVWKFAGGTLPALTTTASRFDVLFYYVESVDGSNNATRITAKLINDVR